MPAKDVGKMAKQEAGRSQGFENDLSGRGSAAWNGMFPTLMNNATNPKGYSDQQMATMNTANSQGAGGVNAGITGQGVLQAGRTRNPGSMAAGLAEAARISGRNENANSLHLQEDNARLAQQKQQSALGELGKLYGTNVSGLNDMVHNTNQSIDEYGKYSQSGLETGMGIFKDLSKIGLDSAKLAMTGGASAAV